ALCIDDHLLDTSDFFAFEVEYLFSDCVFRHLQNFFRFTSRLRFHRDDLRALVRHEWPDNAVAITVAPPTGSENTGFHLMMAHSGGEQAEAVKWKVLTIRLCGEACCRPD